MLKERITRNEVEDAIEKNPNKKWYVLQAASNSEEAAKRNIKIQLEVSNVEDKVGMILIPANQVIEMKKGQKKISNKKLYSGYIYVLAEMDERVWRAIRNANKVSRFVNEKDGALPSPISLKEVKSMLSSLDTEDSAPIQEMKYKEGQPVRVVNGPFADFVGIVESVNYNKNKLKVKLNILGRDTSIELNHSDVSTEVD